MIAAIRVDNTMGVLSFLQTAALKHSGAAVGAYSSLTSSDTGFAKTLVHTFVMSRVDHCNAVLARYITTYNLLNSSNKRACSNTFVHVTLVSSTHNNGQKLKENVKSDTRKLLKRLEKKQFKNKKTTHTKQEHTRVKNLKRQLMTAGFRARPAAVHCLRVSCWRADRVVRRVIPPVRR